MANKIELLTVEERAALPMVISRRARFKNILKVSILNYNKTSSNCLMIIGKPGIGKTFIVTETLEQLLNEDLIASYKRVPGHVSMQSCFNIIQECATPNEGRPRVALFDDTDVMAEEGTLEIIKSAFDSKSNLPSNRKVYFYNRVTGREGIDFRGYGIIIANDDFLNKKLNIHQQAILDRVQLMSIDLKLEDAFIYNTYLIEKLLNENEEGYSDEEIDSIVKMFNTDFRRWNKMDAFRKSQINFSTRLVKKFVDLQKLFGGEWREYSLAYKQLEAACELEELKSGEIEVPSSKVIPSKGVLVKKAKRNTKYAIEPKKNSKGKYIDNKGKEFSAAMQCYFKKKFGAVA